MKAPLFTLPKINSNNNYSLESDLGKIVILTFWTSWCPDCGLDLPKKEALYRSIDKDKVQMLTVNVTGRERDHVSGVDYTKKYLNQPTLADSGWKVYDLYRCVGVPSTVIIGPTGDIVDQFDDQADFLNILESLSHIL